MGKIKKILETIKKLLAMGEGKSNAGNSEALKHEAETAMRKAQELMIKHNVSMEEVDEADEDDEEEYVDDLFYRCIKPVTEDVYIRGILIHFYFIKLYRGGHRKRGGLIFKIVGKKENVEVAKYIWSYLKRTFKDLWHTWKKESGCPTTSRGDFYYGVYLGLTEKLEEERKRLEKDQRISKALVVIDNKLTKYADKCYPKAGDRGEKSPIRGDKESMRAGYEDGKNISLGKGVGYEKSKSTGKLLER